MPKSKFRSGPLMINWKLSILIMKLKFSQYIYTPSGFPERDQLKSNWPTWNFPILETDASFSHLGGFSKRGERFVCMPHSTTNQPANQHWSIVPLDLCNRSPNLQWIVESITSHQTYFWMLLPHFSKAPDRRRLPCWKLGLNQNCRGWSWTFRTIGNLCG